MIRTIYDYYTHEFREEGGIVAAYFQTKTGTEYRVYFYPAKDTFDISHDSVLYRRGYYFGFTKVSPNEDKKEAFDPRVMNTISNIINEFYESDGIECVLLFHCSGEWGDDKKLKRARRFSLWFSLAMGKYSYTKYDEEIIMPVHTDNEYLSIIIENTNPNIETILNEFHEIKNGFTTGKGE